jgi:hypothetical protein
MPPPHSYKVKVPSGNGSPLHYEDQAEDFETETGFEIDFDSGHVHFTVAAIPREPDNLAEFRVRESYNRLPTGVQQALLSEDYQMLNSEISQLSIANVGRMLGDMVNTGLLTITLAGNILTADDVLLILIKREKQQLQEQSTDDREMHVEESEDQVARDIVEKQHDSTQKLELKLDQVKQEEKC